MHADVQNGLKGSVFGYNLDYYDSLCHPSAMYVQCSVQMDGVPPIELFFFFFKPPGKSKLFSIIV